MKKPDDSGAETLFAFRHPDYPHRLAELCVSQGVCARTQHLAGTESCWAGEGEAHLRSVSSGLLNDINIHSVGQKIHNRALRTVDDFVTSVRPTKDTKAPSSSRAGGGEPERGSDSDDSDDSGDSGDASDSDAELHGVAAAEFKVLAQATPDKRRPLVPSFAASSPPAGGQDVSKSARSKPPVAASSASSRTSGRDSSPGPGENEGDEDDEDDTIRRKDWEGWVVCSGCPRMHSNAYPH